MPQAVNRVQPPLEFLPQSLNPFVLQAVRLLLPLWLRFQCRITRVQVENGDRLVNLYHQFQAGKVRLLIAFRHPCTDDPFCMAYLLSHFVPRQARRQGVILSKPVHSYFLYDRGIPLWAGGIAGWLFPRMGGSSICRGKLDMQGLRAARDLLVKGQFPLAAAPEGATNDHSELISPLEPGVAQLGFWCMEDLEQSNRPEDVLIVPVGIQYRYEAISWQRLDQILSQLEADVGLSSPPVQADPSAPILYQRLLSLSEHLLGVMEHHYTRFYGQTFPELVDVKADTANAQLVSRLQRMMEIALQTAESYFGIKPKGNFVDRCRRLEQAGWDRIFREDVARLPPLERGLGDWVAAEASLRLGHMRLVERLTAITGDYIRQQPTPNRFAEITLILWKIITALKGDSPHQPLDLGQRRVKMTIGNPLSVSDRYPEYAKDRRSARQAVTDLTQDLQNALESMIVEAPVTESFDSTV